MDYRFASDNTAGLCPEAWQALQAADRGACASYGEDSWTAEAADAIRAVFGAECDAYFVFNGTAANSLALAACCQSYHSVICSDIAHLVTDECGAPEFFSHGSKLLTAHTADGKLTPAAVEDLVTRRHDLHYAKPRVLSLTLPTEVGTLYSLAELRALRDAAKRYGLFVHIDGARFANAAATLRDRGFSPADLTWRCGADVLCFGGTKNGALAAEAVVFFAPERAREFERRRKRAGQLWSKQRYLSAQLLALLEDGLWLRHARHAHTLAAQLAAGLGRAGLQLAQPVQANEVFAHFPAPLSASLRARGFEFYDWPAPAGTAVPLVRLVTRYDQQPEQVEALLDAIRSA